MFTCLNDLVLPFIERKEFSTRKSIIIVIAIVVVVVIAELRQRVYNTSQDRCLNLVV
jgi:hypothetical protein